jgi:hypothetical protein
LFERASRRINSRGANFRWMKSRHLVGSDQILDALI